MKSEVIACSCQVYLHLPFFMCKISWISLLLSLCCFPLATKTYWPKQKFGVFRVCNVHVPPINIANIAGLPSFFKPLYRWDIANQSQRDIHCKPWEIQTFSLGTCSTGLVKAPYYDHLIGMYKNPSKILWDKLPTSNGCLNHEKYIAYCKPCSEKDFLFWAFFLLRLGVIQLTG